MVCDLPDGDRAYGRIVDADLLAAAETEELVGAKLTSDADRRSTRRWGVNV